MTTASATPFEAPPQAGVVRGFARVGDRQLHVHRAGSGPPVVCFHASPRSAEQLLPVTRQLARSFTVLAFDTPGYGNSDPVPVEEPRIEHYAEAVAEAVAGLGIDRYSIYGFHTGGLIALELTVRHTERVTALVIDGLPVVDDAERADFSANYMPPFRTRGDGSHMVELWASLRACSSSRLHIGRSWRRDANAICRARRSCTSGRWTACARGSTATRAAWRPSSRTTQRPP